MLPLNVMPNYTLTVPSTNQTFKYRPFLVREEKALLIAQQSDDSIVMYDTLRDIIKACAKSDINVDALASFDIEYIFLQLRAVSVGETVDLIFKCDDDHGQDNSKARQKVTIDVREAKVEGLENQPSLKIPLFDDVGVCMKYPTIETLKKIEASIEESVDFVFDIVINCIDYIYNTEEVFPAKEQSKSELVTFLNSLSSIQFKKIEEFFDNIPKLRLEVKYSCPVCNKKHNKFLEGISSFF